MSLQHWSIATGAMFFFFILGALRVLGGLKEKSVKMNFDDPVGHHRGAMGYP